MLVQPLEAEDSRLQVEVNCPKKSDRDIFLLPAQMIRLSSVSNESEGGCRAQQRSGMDLWNEVWLQTCSS